MLSLGHFVASALVGAIIGYITNWIAIKMLFRPLSPWRILGFKVPFTPGVIPKEKDRLARSIGEAVSLHLLDSEYLSRQLLQPRTEERVRSFIRNKLQENGDKTVAAVCENLGLDEAGREKLLGNIKQLVAAGLQDDRLQGFLAGQLAAGLTPYLQLRPLELLGGAGSISRRVKQILEQKESRRQLLTYLQEKEEELSRCTLTIREVLPDSLVEGMKKTAGRQVPRIVGVMESYLDSPQTKQLLVKRVEQFFDQGPVRRFMANVLGILGGNARQIADKIVNETASFLTAPENSELLAQKTQQVLEGFLDRRVCDVVSTLKKEVEQETGMDLATWTVEKIYAAGLTEKIAAGVESALDQSGKSTGQILKLGGKEELERWCREAIARVVAAPDFARFSGENIDLAAKRLFAAPVASVCPPAGERAVKLEETGLRFYRRLVGEYLPGILDFLDFGDLVRQRVKELNVQEVEELVLGIMRRELVAITWLGAVLGGVIGITMVILQVLL